MSFVKDVENYIRSGETKGQNLGLEIEHFVVDKNGDQIGFDLVTSLIEKVIGELKAAGQEVEEFVTDGHIVGYQTPDYSVTLEPACQFEISVRPESKLAEIKRIYDEFYGIWSKEFAEHGYQIITGGNLPKVEKGELDPVDIPLSKKNRYKYMDQYFASISPFGRYMMRCSGSTQVSIDYSSEEDMVRKLRILEKISPILMLMMENKVDENSTLPGGEGKPHLHRTQEWDLLDPARTGYYPHAFDEDFGYFAVAHIIASTPLILLTRNGETEYVGNANATKLLESGAVDYDAMSEAEKKAFIEHVMSMGFFHYRIKKYLEVRVADAAPIEKSVAYAALLKGLLYSEESLAKLEEDLAHIDGPAKIQAATVEIEKFGKEAVLGDGKTAKEWMSSLVSIARKALSDGDKEYLKAFEE